VPGSSLGRVGGAGQTVGRELAQRRQHAVPRLRLPVLGDNHRPIDEIGEDGEHVPHAQVVGAHRVRRLQRTGPREHRQPVEQRSARGGEQVIGPRDRGHEGAVPRMIR
jgi:hypothetical protein